VETPDAVKFPVIINYGHDPYLLVAFGKLLLGKNTVEIAIIILKNGKALAKVIEFQLEFFYLLLLLDNTVR
jgi:hypothetical protein